MRPVEELLVNQPITRHDKIREYHQYLCDHIANVQMVWKKLQKIMRHEKVIWNDFENHIMSQIIDDHDASKFDDLEFHAFRKRFYPFEGEEQDPTSYARAWNRHVHGNSHHWEHWLNCTPGAPARVYPLEMGYFDILEMLCDQTAMDLHNRKGCPSDFFQKNRSKMMLSVQTLKTIEGFLPYLDQAYWELTEPKVDNPVCAPGPTGTDNFAFTMERIANLLAGLENQHSATVKEIRVIMNECVKKGGVKE